MEKYSVTQVAEILRTNPETVRRWIRSGRLNASQISRKYGNVIEESELKRFIKNSPKYASIAKISTIPASLGVVGIAGAVATSLAASLVIGHAEDKKSREFIVKDDDIEKYIETTIAESEIILQNKAKDVEKLNEEIKTEKEKIAELKKMLAYLKK